MTLQAFISYKREDQSFAEQLRDAIHNWGHRVWLDVFDIPSGTAPSSKGWDDAIHKGMKQSQVVIGFLTPESLASENVLDEWGWALTNQRRLFLLWLRDVSEEDIPPRLIRIQRIDLRKNVKAGLERLQQALTTPSLTMPSPIAPAVPSQSKPLSLPSQDSNRAKMLAKVQTNWVEGVLNTAITDVEFELQLSFKTDAVLKHLDYGDYNLPDTTEIGQIFTDMGGKLLILGAPGAGKTVLLLQLVRSLLDRATTDTAHPIPIVFNLSSWGEYHGSLIAWIVDRLWQEYQVPRKVAVNWIENERLLLMLDGLDEVREDYRTPCVKAINIFLQHYPTVNIVVSSRIADYEQLAAQLDLKSAIALQPLLPEQIDKLLSPTEYATLRHVMAAEPHLEEIATVPYLLNTMMFAYRGASLGEIDQFNEKTERVHRLFDRYIKQRLSQGQHPDFTLAKTRHWLSWLASRMENSKQSLFYIGGMQPDWLEDQRTRRWYGLSVHLSLMSVLFVCCLFIAFALYNAIYKSMNVTAFMIQLLAIYGVAGLLSYVVAYWLGRVGFVQGVGCRPALMKFRVCLAIIAGTLLGSIFVYFMMTTLTGGWIEPRYYSPSYLESMLRTWIETEHPDPDTIRSSIKALENTFIFIGASLVFSAIIGSWAGILGTQVKQTRSRVELRYWSWARANRSFQNKRRFFVRWVVIQLLGPILLFGLESQGLIPSRTWLSLLVGSSALYLVAVLRAGIVSPRFGNVEEFYEISDVYRYSLGIPLLAGCISALSMGLFSVVLSPEPSIIGFISASGISGLILGIPVFLSFGGLDSLRHTVLRFIFRSQDHIPTHYPEFLDYCVEMHLLRKVGIGYMFTHRMLLEYFASQYVNKA